jgi:hypothetical protein
MLVSLALALAVPAIVETGNRMFFLPYILVALGFFVGIPAIRAILRPVPDRVQVVIKRALLGLVALDAALAVALAGPSGLIILFLLIPTIVLARWVYTT